jgi:hypothetical protein
MLQSRAEKGIVDAIASEELREGLHAAALIRINHNSKRALQEYMPHVVVRLNAPVPNECGR